MSLVGCNEELSPYEEDLIVNQSIQFIPGDHKGNIKKFLLMLFTLVVMSAILYTIVRLITKLIFPIIFTT